MQLTKNLIRSTIIKLASINDPYAQFTEFLLRYSAYKSYVLQI